MVSVDEPSSQADRRQRELEYFAQPAEEDYRPAIREAAEAVGALASPGTVSDDLAALAGLGLLADRDLPEGRKHRDRRAARADGHCQTFGSTLPCSAARFLRASHCATPLACLQLNLLRG